MPVSGHVAVVKISGSPTTMTNSTMASSDGGYTWQINSTARRIWDKDTAVSFTIASDSSTIATERILSIDYLQGKVVFDTSYSSTVVRVTGKYLPTTEVLGAKGYTLTATAAILKSSDLSNVGYETKEPNIKDIQVTLDRFNDADDTFYDVLKDSEEVVIDLSPDGTFFHRGWFKVPDTARKMTISELLTESITFHLAGDITVGKTYTSSDM